MTKRDDHTPKHHAQERAAELDGRTTLITGGAGFVGRHLAAQLRAEGAEVRVLDDLSAGQSAPQSVPGFGFRNGTVLDERLVAEEVERADFVYHLAAVVGVDRVLREPLRAASVNGRGTEHVVDACARYRVPMLYTSSSEVYGPDPRGVCQETDEIVCGSPTDARGGYAFSKAQGEWRVLAQRETTGLEAIVVRLFNTVGPGQQSRGGMVLPRFVRAALRGEPLTVHGDGRQVRCFADVREVARALVELPACEEAYGRILNVGSTRECSIRQLAERVLVRSGSGSKLVSVDSERPYDPKRRRPDLAQLQRALGWVPDWPLDRTIDAVIEDRLDRSERESDERLGRSEAVVSTAS